MKALEHALAELELAVRRVREEIARANADAPASDDAELLQLAAERAAKLRSKRGGR